MSSARLGDSASTLGPVTTSCDSRVGMVRSSAPKAIRFLRSLR